MPGFGTLVAKFFGNAASTAAGFAAGEATSAALVPELQDIINEAWAGHPDRVPSAETMAEAAAQGKLTAASVNAALPAGIPHLPKALSDPVDIAKFWAKYTGYGDGPMTAMIEAASEGPPLGQAISAFRRKTISETEYHLALHNAGIPQTWWKPLTDLATVKLDPSDIARGVHKSLIPDPGLLAVPQPHGTGKVKAYPVYPIDALVEAAAAGYDKERLGVLVGLQGNPMGAHEAAQALFRGVLEQVDYDRAIAEGNTRNEWGPPIMEQSRQIPTSVDYAENTIRGWSSKADFFAGAATHGMTQAHAEILWQNHGRPLAHNQVLIGQLRGGIYDGPTDHIDPVYLTSLRHSSVRPEYYNLAWAGRFHFPPFFQTVNLLSKGFIDAATATHWLTIQAYDPDAIATVVKSASGGTAKVKKFTDSQIRSAARSGAIDHAEAIKRLEANGYSAADAEIVLNLPTTTPAKP